MSESSPSGHSRRRWWVLLAMTAGFLGTGLLALVLIVRECGKGEFSAKLGALLSERLDARVELSPMRSHSLVFLDCPSVEVRDWDGRWAFHAKDVSFELLPSGIWAGGLGFRSVLVREAELWLGAEPNPDHAPSGKTPSLPPEGKSNSLPWWLQGRLRDPARVPMESIEIRDLKIRGHESIPKEAAFEVDTNARGRLRDGRLEWSLDQGRFEIPGREAWSLGEFQGEWDQDGLRVAKGLLVSPEGAVVSCHSRDAQEPEQLALEIEARQVKLHPTGTEVEEALGPISSASASVTGVLLVRFPDVHRFHFQGDVQLEGLSLGKSKIFRLLSGQTGERKLRHPESRVLTGRMECTPGVVRLTRLSFAEKGLFRLEGWLSIVAEEVLGVFDLALPAPMVGRIPGGKPRGFSYPASGWSWARLRVEGKNEQWQEDLSQRLMAQISRDIPVKAGPPPAATGPEKSPDAIAAAIQRKKESTETLFYSLIEN